MNKKEFLRAISIESGLSLKDSSAFLNAFTSVVIEDVKNGGKVTITKLGTFSKKHKGPRPGRNMHTGTPMMIAETNILSFKPADAVKNYLIQIHKLLFSGQFSSFGLGP